MEERRWHTCAGEFVAIPAHHTLGGSDPQLRPLERQKAVYLTVAQSIRPENAALARVEEPSTLCTQPNLTVAGFRHGSHRRVRYGQAVRRESGGPTEAR